MDNVLEVQVSQSHQDLRRDGAGQTGGRVPAPDAAFSSRPPNPIHALLCAPEDARWGQRGHWNPQGKSQSPGPFTAEKGVEHVALERLNWAVVPGRSREPLARGELLLKRSY